MKKITIALVGQPNVGKTQLLNALSGANLKVGNYAGVTVDVAKATLQSAEYEIELIDLPGVYSIEAHGKDEWVTRQFLLHERYDLILNVIDGTNLERNLFLTTELMELNRKMIVALNMWDECQKEGIFIDHALLGELLGFPCIPVSSRTKENLEKLLDRLIATHAFPKGPNKLLYSDSIEHEILALKALFASKGDLSEMMLKGDERYVATHLLKQDKEAYERLHAHPLWVELQSRLQVSLENIYTLHDSRDMDAIFSGERHAFARGAALEAQRRQVPKQNLTERIDAVLIHRFFGIPIFLFFMWALFQITFELGSIPMDWIDAGFSAFGEAVGAHVESEAARSLLVDGIISGVGAVTMFLPNIIILFVGIALLEGTGYMTRVAFLLDGFFHKFGLHGKSFIPLVTGFGCSVPAYMAARTLKSEKDRLITMFIIGFMSCGAKLPVYVLFAGAFFPGEMAGNVLFVIYISGALLGLVAAKFLRLFVFRGEDEMFVMEMPKYRFPSLALIWFTVWSKSWMYLKKAGTFILAASILIWFISSYPKNGELAAQYEDERIFMQKQMELSYMGQLGGLIEPIFAPLGFDWKMSVATLSGLAAKEVIVSTLGVLYALGDEVDEKTQSLQERLRENIPLPSAVAFIVFVMIYLPCLAATAVFTKEAGSYKYTVYLVVFTFATAWTLALLARWVTAALIA